MYGKKHNIGVYRTLKCQKHTVVRVNEFTGRDRIYFNFLIELSKGFPANENYYIKRPKI